MGTTTNSMDIRDPNGLLFCGCQRCKQNNSRTSQQQPNLCRNCHGGNGIHHELDISIQLGAGALAIHRRDLPITNQRDWNERCSQYSVALQLHVLVSDAIHDQRVGQLHLHLLRHLGHHYGYASIPVHQRDSWEEH